MKSACCKHEIVIQTDPKNCEYVIISGAQKKTEEYDVEDAETLLLPVDEGKDKYDIGLDWDFSIKEERQGIYLSSFSQKLMLQFHGFDILMACRQEDSSLLFVWHLASLF